MPFYIPDDAIEGEEPYTVSINNDSGTSKRRMRRRRKGAKKPMAKRNSSNTHSVEKSTRKVAVVLAPHTDEERKQVLRGARAFLKLAKRLS